MDKRKQLQNFIEQHSPAWLTRKVTGAATGRTQRLNPKDLPPQLKESQSLTLRALIEFQWSGEWGSPNIYMIPKQKYPAQCQVILASSYNLVLCGTWTNGAINKVEELSGIEGATMELNLPGLLDLQRIRTVITEDGRIFHDPELWNSQPEILTGLIEALQEKYGAVSAAKMCDAWEAERSR